jgi:hypothetical protein
MNQFVDGAIMMAFCVAGLCFLRFWRRTHDSFFLMFALAFWVMAINRLFLSWLATSSNPNDEHRVVLYGVRLLSFVIILVAIIMKNRKG